MRHLRLIASAISFFLLLSFNHLPAFAQDKPFIMPVAAAASPSTWLFGQPYGNTVGAYNFGTAWYSAGQGLHFGIDVSMPCGTPLVAVAEGDVIYADNLTFGAAPHNLILRHDAAGLTTLYGHLLDTPVVKQYQHVQQGDLVGYSGDPDLTCDSRPHLHFEVRSLDYRTAYNPLDYIAANWDVLAAIGQFNNTPFEIDLTNPRQWVGLNDQPPVAFGGRRLNAYAQSWPPDGENRPPNSAAPLRPFTPLANDAVWRLRPISVEGCCASFWWNPANASQIFGIDGSPGQQAGIFTWDDGAMLNVVGQVPPPYTSPDGAYQIALSNGQTTIQRVSDGALLTVSTGGFPPAMSADNGQLLWQVQHGQSIPGATPPQVEIWVSNVDGSNARMIMNGTRLSASWLDGSRLLVSQSEHTVTTLSVYSTFDGSTFTLGSWDRIRGISLAPGGGRLLFYQTFQSDTTVNAVYALDTQPGAVAQKLPWFGAYRWRDAESVYYIPFEPEKSTQTLAYYHVPSGENRLLTDAAALPFTVANGTWAVSADGSTIAFQSATDHRLWLLDAAG